MNVVNLIERLRGTYRDIVCDGPFHTIYTKRQLIETPPLNHEAANALESQTKYIIELETELDKLKLELANWRSYEANSQQ